MLFAVHLVPLGVLGHLSGLIPRPDQPLLVAWPDSATSWTASAYLLVDDYSAAVGAFTFLGELLLGLWLVARGGATHLPSRTRSTPAQVTEPARTPSSA